MKKIPRIAYFYWGNINLPFLRYLTLYSFRKYNPDWKIKLYYPKISVTNLSWVSSEHKFDLPNEDYSEKLKNLNIEQIEFDMESIGWPNGLSEVLKSDLIRWHLLSTEGGLWSDMDILFFKPMRCIQNNDAEAFVSFVLDHWTVGFMMSTPNNTLFVELNRVSKINFDPGKYQSVGSQLFFRLAGSIKALKEKFNTVNIYNIPPDTVYPLPSGKTHLIYDSNDMNYLKNETIGLHWYAGRKDTSDKMKSINEQTYKQQKNIICNLIKGVLG
jgi:hypothetical protein